MQIVFPPEIVGLLLYGTVLALAPSGNVVYAGGEFGAIGGEQRAHLAALDVTSGAATSWDPAPNGTVHALLAHGSTLYVGGDFTRILGQPYTSFAAVTQAVTGVVPGAPAAGLRLSVAPNPFRGRVALRIETQHATESEVQVQVQVQVQVLDLAGRLVRTLHRGALAAGGVDLAWEGLDDRGRAAPAGLYLVRARAGDRSQTTRVLRLR